MYDKLLRLELDEFKPKNKKNKSSESGASSLTFGSSGFAIDSDKKNLGAQINDNE